MRSNWDYQFIRELPLGFVARYDETDAGPLTRLSDDENLNFDLLLRYVINPWPAFYVGYNSNQSNLDIVEMEGERELIVANDLRRDGDQFFIKFSYLFQRQVNNMQRIVSKFFAGLALCLAVINPIYAQSAGGSMADNEKIVREFIAAWSNLDPEELAGYFTEDGTYHNIPSTAVSGRANIQQFITGFIQPWEQTDWEIISLVANGDMVTVERLDKTVVAGSPVNLPCVGIFEMEGGKIKVWRDYFDLATYTDALTAALRAAQQ